MASTLFINAQLWQPDGSFNQAFGIDGNVINFAGSNNEAKTLKHSYANIIDLNGKLVLPGLIDGHLHLVYGSLMRKRLDASGINTMHALKEAIGKYNDKNQAVKWVVGSNLYLNEFLKNVPEIHGNIIDNIYNDKPLFITNYDYHSAICNSRGIEESGLKKRLNEFTEQEVERDSSGNLTGIIREKAMEIVFDNLPEATISEKTDSVSEFINILHSYGITSVTDITQREDLEVYNKLFNTGNLSIRINSYLPFSEFPDLKQHYEYTKDINPDFFTINGFKAFWDGALGSETALFSRNYNDRNHNGYQTDDVKSGNLKKLAKDICSGKGQMIIHAIGDKAVTEVLDLYESLYSPEANSRHRIEHAQHIADTDIERFKKFNVIASVQPIHLKYDAKTVKEKLPDELIASTHNYKKLVETGAVVNFGTDFPIVDVNPFENIQIALTRKVNGEPFTPANAFNLHECLKCYTYNNAYSNFNENAIGSVKPGKQADFVIMKDNLFEINPDDIAKAQVYKTYLNGKEVYSI
jgi:predicted amidohydrolase YtcJ